MTIKRTIIEVIVIGLSGLAAWFVSHWLRIDFFPSIMTRTSAGSTIDYLIVGLNDVPPFILLIISGFIVGYLSKLKGWISGIVLGVAFSLGSIGFYTLLYLTLGGPVPPDFFLRQGFILLGYIGVAMLGGHLGNRFVGKGKFLRNVPPSVQDDNV